MSCLTDDHDFTLFLALVSALLLTLFSDLFLTLCSLLMQLNASSNLTAMEKTNLLDSS